MGLPTMAVDQPRSLESKLGASVGKLNVCSEKINAFKKENWTIIRKETQTSFLVSLHFVLLCLGTKGPKTWMWLLLNSLPGVQVNIIQSHHTTDRSWWSVIMSALKAKQSQAWSGQSRKINQSRRKKNLKQNKPTKPKTTRTNLKEATAFPSLSDNLQNRWSWLTLRSDLPQELNRDKKWWIPVEKSRHLFQEYKNKR